MSNHFFDIGANVGQTFDDYLAKTSEHDGWEVWCFEPSPRHVPALMEKAASMGERYKIHVCPFGLRGESAIQHFYPKDDARGDSFQAHLVSDHVTNNLSLGFVLHAVAVDVGAFILEQTQPGDAVVLKMDCEGSEYHLLTHLLANTAALERVKSIMVEFHTIETFEPVMHYEELQQKYREIGKPLEQWKY